jgi:serine/threonine protein kinase
MLMRMPSGGTSQAAAASSGGLSSAPDDRAAPAMPPSSGSGGARISGGGASQMQARSAVRTDAVLTPRPTDAESQQGSPGAGAGAPAPRGPVHVSSPGAAAKPAPEEKAAAPGKAATGLPADFPEVPLPLTIKQRWKFKHRIGQGSFGAVFSGRDLRTKARVAAKLEPVGPKRSLLKTEVALLKELQGTGYVCRYIASGCVNGFNYLIMELLADNLAQNFRTHRQSKLLDEIKGENAKHEAAAAAAGPSAAPPALAGAAASAPPAAEQQQEPRFTVAALTFTQVAFLGRQMVRAMQSLHEHGYLHRDVKPSNFALGLQPGSISTCYTIDFGLARRYRDEKGAHREARPNPGFRGTARYASLNAHRNLELSRRDDLWSIFFIVFEFTVGVLPWAGLSGRDEIGAAKEQWLVDAADDSGPSPICTLPHPLPSMFEALQKLDYADEPDYDALVRLFDHAGPSEPMSDPSCDPPSDPITPASPPRAELAMMMPPAPMTAMRLSEETQQRQHHHHQQQQELLAAKPGAAAQVKMATTEAAEPAPAVSVSVSATVVAPNDMRGLCPRPPTHARPPSGRGGRPPMLAARRSRFATPKGTGRGTGTAAVAGAVAGAGTGTG